MMSSVSFPYLPVYSRHDRFISLQDRTAAQDSQESMPAMHGGPFRTGEISPLSFLPG
jgi:hypothetical protein